MSHPLPQPSPASGEGVLTRSERRLVEALAARIFPTTDTPGATEAGAIIYIDRALAGAYWVLVPYFRRSLRGINRQARAAFGGPFTSLVAAQQDELVADLEAGRVPTIRDGPGFFAVLRRLVLEGMFCEPSYGGNRDLVGWRLVGFPGQQFGYPDPYINRGVDLPTVAVEGVPSDPRASQRMAETVSIGSAVGARATRRPSRSAPRTADVCIVGVGAVGGILAKELASAGLDVVAFNRGPVPQLDDYGRRDTTRFVVRSDQLEWVRDDPTTVRPRAGQRATVRYGTSPANALGGSLLHWTGQASRFFPGDFEVFTNEIASGLADRAGADLGGYDVVDWPIGYEDLQPYYERFEWEFGVSGRAGVNPFEGPRPRGYPVPPLRHSAKMELFAEACRRLGYHPFDTPAGILSEAYRPTPPFDSRIAERQACVYCGHCNYYGCHVQAKAASLYSVIPVAIETGNLDLRNQTRVVRINTDSQGQATGVTYVDPEGSLHEQRARVVMLAAFVFENVRLLLLSGEKGLANSSGLVGRYILAHGDARVHGFFEDYIINGFIGPGSAAMRIDDFNGNNFDHTGLGFIRGGTIGTSGDGAPIQRVDVLPPGASRWGATYKDYFARAYTRTFDLNIQPETLPHRDNRVDLDPTYSDLWGVPLPRTTFAFHENERRLQRFMVGIGEGIMREAGATSVWSEPKTAPNRWAGGTRMGDDPRRSVVNGYCQSHDVPNLFVIGSSAFPTMAGYPPTATIAALAYRTAEHVLRQREWFR